MEADEQRTRKGTGPIHQAVIEVEIPTVVVCGTYEDCCMMLIISPDPSKCAKFRGSLENEPELREYLKESGHKIKQIEVGPDGIARLVQNKLLC